MTIDPNPGRSTPRGGREYPAGAAGTLLSNGLVLSGDDAPAFQRAGWSVMPVTVGCSAEIAAGRQPIPPTGHVFVAIDRNGASLERVAALAQLDAPAYAQGIYNGALLPSITGWMPSDRVLDAHDVLLAELPGFQCFALLNARD